MFLEESNEFTAEEVEVLQNDSVKRDFDALRNSGKKPEAKNLLAYFVSLNRIHNHWKSQLIQGELDDPSITLSLNLIIF